MNNIKYLLLFLFSISFIPYAFVQTNNCDHPDYDALVALNHSISGLNWDINDCDVCSWEGIICNEQDRVSSIDRSFELVELVGTIPSEIGNLSQLKKLVLSTGDQLVGIIPPEIGNLSQLNTLILQGNLTGNIPPEIAKLQDLKILIFSSNQLTGNIPFEIGKLIKLTSLNLNNNQLTGNIPFEIGKLIKLTSLNLNNNQLTGNIPFEIGKLIKLTSLNFRNNQLTGIIPHEIGLLINLTGLDLANNDLSGSIPPEIGNLSKMTLLDFTGNNLTGFIPKELAQTGSTVSLGLATGVINLRSNQLSGCYPRELEVFCRDNRDINLLVENNPDLSFGGDFNLACSSNEGFCSSSNEVNCSTLQFTSQSNQITVSGLSPSSKIELIGQHTDWQIVPVCEGNCSESQVIADLQAGDYFVKVQLFGQNGTFCYREEQVSVSGQSLDCAAGDYPRLVSFYKSTNGEDWINKWDTTNCDICSWYGVTCTTFRPGVRGVTKLGLSNNNLSGTLPLDIGEMINMRVLDLSNNHISGSLPTSFLGIGLTGLDLSNNQMSGEIPESIRLFWTSTLNLSNNQFSGEIPPEISGVDGSVRELVDSVIINLENNQLSGCYPTFLKNFHCPKGIQSTYFLTEGNPDLPFQGDFSKFCETGLGSEDLDNDGICNSEDCDDTNASIGASQPPGTACDDSNPNTVNDMVGEDGCTCVGTPISGGTADCSTLQFTSQSNQITVSGLSPSSKIELIGQHTDWQIVPVCEGNCSESQVIADLQAGDYFVKVQLFGQNGTFCYREEQVSVSGQSLDCADRDYPFLVSFYKSTNGEDWINKWDTTNCDICSWYGITCNGFSPDASRVSKLGLSNNNLSGTLPLDIGEMSNMRVLDLSNNHISGSLPTSFLGIGLTGLDLSNNQMNGEIPPEIWRFAMMANLDLSNNQFSGPIPSGIGSIGFAIRDFVDSIIVDIENNQLSGCYPPLLKTFHCVGTSEPTYLFTQDNPDLPFQGDYFKFCETGLGSEDLDNDGICNSEDCDDTNASIGASQPPGTACDDSNSNTVNDMVGEDGCTCVGTPISGGTADCSTLQFTSQSNQITVSGLSPSSKIELIGQHTDWQIVPVCEGNCSESQVIADLQAGDYFVKVQLFGQDGTFCYREEQVSVSGGGGTGGAADCNKLVFTGGDGQITIAGLTATYDKVEIIGRNTNWQVILVCEGNCMDTQIIPDLLAGDYTVKVYQGGIDGSFCYREELVVITTSSANRNGDLDAEKAISLYPNPAKTELWVDWGEFSGQSGTVSIYNVLGQKITQKAYTTGDKPLRFNVSDYQNGLYYLAIEAKGNRSITKRFVVENWK